MPFEIWCTVDLFFAIIATDSHIATEPHFYKFHFVLAMEPQSYRTRFGVRQLLSIKPRSPGATELAFNVRKLCLFSHGAMELGIQLLCQNTLVNLAMEPRNYKTRFGVRQPLSF